jgi:hypothetical protein
MKMEKTYNGQLKAKVNAPICIVSNQSISFGSSGYLELRKESKTGDLIESFDVDSDRVKISARELLIYPTTQLPYETEIYLVISDGFIVSSVNGSSFSGFDVDGNLTYKFTTEKPYAPITIEFEIGDSLGGGTIISKENGIYTIISPKSAEMNLTWYEINRAIGEVQEKTKNDGWYLPSLHEMQKHVNDWKSSEELYWTGTEVDSNEAYALNMNINVPYATDKSESHLIRLFKKVNY